jgi:hypothetical protein
MAIVNHHVRIHMLSSNFIGATAIKDFVFRSPGIDNSKGRLTCRKSYLLGHRLPGPRVVIEARDVSEQKDEGVHPGIATRPSESC